LTEDDFIELDDEDPDWVDVHDPAWDTLFINDESDSEADVSSVEVF
jgi:hypothetical protein